MKKFVLLIVSLSIATFIFSQSNDIQAELFDKNGQPVDGTGYGVTFSMWSTATGGTGALWSQAIAGVTIQKGSISAFLGGSAAPFPSDLFTTSEDRYIEITITKDSVSETLSPRMKIASSLYSIAGTETSSDCPSGMVKASYFCIDVQRSTEPRTYYAAHYNCQDRGLRLCGWMDLMNACELLLLDINNSTPMAEEWTVDATGRMRQSTWGLPYEGVEYCYRLSNDLTAAYGTWEMKYYRCCR
jgi:hypothetical protein